MAALGVVFFGVIAGFGAGVFTAAGTAGADTVALGADAVSVARPGVAQATSFTTF